MYATTVEKIVAVVKKFVVSMDDNCFTRSFSCSVRGLQHGESLISAALYTFYKVRFLYITQRSLLFPWNTESHLKLSSLGAYAPHTTVGALKPMKYFISLLKLQAQVPFVKTTLPHILIIEFWFCIKNIITAGWTKDFYVLKILGWTNKVQK